MILSASNLKKTYRQGDQSIEILKNLSLQVDSGEIVSIIGPSGSGKSTLLGILSGIDKPDAGQLLIGSTDLFALSEAQRVAYRGRKIGIIFQQFHLLSHLTALENVMLPLEISHSKNKSENKSESIKTKALNMLDCVGLKDRIHHLPHQLSGGEGQRVAIARALVIEPELLLADEPSGSLDEKTGEKVIDLLFSTLRSRKVTSILVTHSRELAQKCDRILEMHNGVLV